MQSPEGEKVFFTGRVIPKGDVEVWLANF